MYKIISIKDREGNDKTDFYNEIKSLHPNMSGEILYPEHIKVGGVFCLVWSDNTKRMLQTSTIERYENNKEKIEVVTRNSIYILKKVE